MRGREKREDGMGEEEREEPIIPVGTAVAGGVGATVVGLLVVGAMVLGLTVLQAPSRPLESGKDR